MKKIDKLPHGALWIGRPSLILSYSKLIWAFVATLLLIWYEFNFDKTHIYIYYLYFIIAGYSFIAWGIKVLQLKTTVYTLKKDRLLIKRGILRRITDELELFRVRDFQLDEPIALRLFSLGNLVLVTSDRTTPYLRLDAIPELSKLHEYLRNLVRECWDDRGVREIDAG